MSRLQQAFIDLKEANQTALLGFLTAGDPTQEHCFACVQEMIQQGCDMIIIGVPFSDPVAEGPIIQKANLRALAHHQNMEDCMRITKQIRTYSDIPVIYQLYYNQLFRYGVQAFMQQCRSVGVDALIIADLPYEHRDELLPLAKDNQIDLIPFVTPNTMKRMDVTTLDQVGFLYCLTPPNMVSSLSHSLREKTAYPIIVDGNAYSIDEFRNVKQQVDGIILSDRIVKEIEKITTMNHSAKDVGAFIKTYR